MLLFSCCAMACSCFYTPMSAKKIMDAELAIEGKIVGKKIVAEPGSNEAPGEQSYGGSYEYTVRVNDVIKGKYSKKTITIFSSTQGATCGVNLSLNEVYYLYAYTYGDYYSTGLCSNNSIKKSVSKRYKQIIRQFKKDKKNTIWTDEQCELVAEGKIVNEAANGNWKFYNPDGSMESEGIFKNGKKVGMWKEYYSKEYSADLWKRLTDEQKATVKNKENILVRIKNYADGEIENSENLFD